MDIKKIDPNFDWDNTINTKKTDFYDVNQSPFEMYGVFYDTEQKKYLRFDSAVAHSVSDGVAYLNAHTSGGRIRFSTNSNNLSIIANYSALDKMSHMTLSGQAGFSLMEDTPQGQRLVMMFRPEVCNENGFKGSVCLKSRKKVHYYTLYFPLYNDVQEVLLGFDKGAVIGEGIKYKNIPPIVYYGSSITQGGCANRPDTDYEALICKQNNIDFINLGFSGNAKGEKEMAEYIASIKSSVYVIDYDYNAPTSEHLQKTHYNFYKIIRDKNPLTPIIIISSPDFHTMLDSKIRLSIIKDTYIKAQQNGDENVYFIDGRTLFGKEWRNCTVDGCHPTDLGFYFMAKKIGGLIDKILNK